MKAMVTDTKHKKSYHVGRQSNIVQGSLAVAKAGHDATEEDLEFLPVPSIFSSLMQEP